MDDIGNIYSIEQMRREIESMGLDDPRRAEFERRIAEDKSRMDGYLKGRSDSDMKAASEEMRKKIDEVQTSLDI